MRAREFIREDDYPENLGVMETFKFYQMASPEEKIAFKKLLRDIKEATDNRVKQSLLERAWQMIQDVTGMKLHKLVEGVIMEGGNIFKNEDGSPATQRIMLADIKPTVKWLESITGLSLLDNMLGTTGRKESSGDLDLAVDVSKISKDQVAEILKSWAARNKLDDREYIRKSGDSVHLKTPIRGDPKNGFVQTDFMMGEPSWQKFSLAGGEINSPYKGMHRHLLMASIAKALGLKWSYKHGLVSRASDKVIARDPDHIAEILLGPGHTSKDLASVETIWRNIKGREDFDKIVEFFKADLEREGLPLP